MIINFIKKRESSLGGRMTMLNQYAYILCGSLIAVLLNSDEKVITKLILGVIGGVIGGLIYKLINL